MNNKETMPSSDRIAFDPEACTGCECCELACSDAHFGGYSKKLSAIRIKADFTSGDRKAYICRQCDAASCVAACKVDAIKFDEATGARYIDQDLCINCGQCVKACPFADQSEAFPLIKKASVEGEKVIIKCDLCHGVEGGPACVEICPRLALTVVTRRKGR